MVSASLSNPPAKIRCVSRATKTTHFPSRLPFLSTRLQIRTKFAPFKSCCTNKSNADDPFEAFSVLSPDIPWDEKSIWSTFAGYFFSLHIPLSFGGLSIVARILDQPVLDPSIMALSALLLQTTELLGALALLKFAAKPECSLSFFFLQKVFSEQRSWIKASVFGTVFLIGLVFFTSILADQIIGPKDVNNQILKEILLYSPTSKTSCFLLYCLVTPLLEETVFRGFLLTSLASRMKWWQAVIISSGFFSLAHISEPGNDSELSVFASQR